MNKKLVLSLFTITLLITVSFLGCSPDKTTKPSKEYNTNIEDKSLNSSTSDVKTDNNVAASVQSSIFKYTITSIPSNTKIELNTEWENSPIGGFKASIEGKGKKVEEEGYSHIIIKDEKANKLTKLTLDEEKKNSITAKDLEWIDEDNMFVIIGQPFGTISKGGKLYKLNIKSGKVFLYEDTSSPREEFVTINKVGSNFNFEKFIYDDDNFTQGHTVSGSLKLK